MGHSVELVSTVLTTSGGRSHFIVFCIVLVFGLAILSTLVPKIFLDLHNRESPHVSFVGTSGATTGHVASVQCPVHCIDPTPPRFASQPDTVEVSIRNRVVERVSI